MLEEALEAPHTDRFSNTDTVSPPPFPADYSIIAIRGANSIVLLVAVRNRSRSRDRIATTKMRVRESSVARSPGAQEHPRARVLESPIGEGKGAEANENRAVRRAIAD